VVEEALRAYVGLDLLERVGARSGPKEKQALALHRVARLNLIGGKNRGGRLDVDNAPWISLTWNRLKGSIDIELFSGR
jgi:hypothetical protein